MCFCLLIVALESLLSEMRMEPNASFEACSARLWSSYDRRSVRNDGEAEGWYANHDWSNWIRQEKVAGRTECVMVDAKGPGVVTRIWTANGEDTVLRFYLDGAAEPTWTELATNLTFSLAKPIPYPLQNAISPKVEPRFRAYNLYLPIPYAKSIRITAELPKSDHRFWYNVETRTYTDPSTSVETLTPAVLKRAEKEIARTANALRGDTTDATARMAQHGFKTLKPGGTATFEVGRITEEGSAIRGIDFGLDCETMMSLRLRMTFDGEETVDVRAAQLAGNPFAAQQSMPFAKSCSVVIDNLGTNEIDLSKARFNVVSSKWKGLHFGAYGFALTNIPTRVGKAGYYELPWVSLEGKGYLVGHALILNNKADCKKAAWWGEGDEKIYVDGETFPSYFGTGTEDFFGYAWGPNKAYDAAPFLSMPVSDGDHDAKGRHHAEMWRLRKLDIVPFRKSVKLDVELWHWQDATMDYAPATFWYARPGVKVVSPASVAPFKPGERVLFYGDSITHGGKFIYYLQLFENLRHPGSNVRLMNGGRSGGSNWHGLANFDREMKVSRPDRAFVMFGMNDIGRDKWMEATPSETMKAARASTLGRYATNTVKLVKRFQAAGVTEILMTPTPYDQYNKDAGENVPFCNDPGLSSAAEIVRAIAASNALKTVELHRPMTKLFKDHAEDFVFCRDRVHPGGEGNLYMTALLLDAMGVSPEVDSFTCEVEAGAEKASFDYAPKALPFPRMPEYETIEAFFPFTERFNREMISFKGLKQGRYTLAFDGTSIGVYSSEELAKGVNVALLDTPNQRRAQALVPVMRKLQSVVADYRNFVLVERMIEDHNVDITDFAAADKWLDQWLEKQKKTPWYDGVKAWADGYRAGRSRVKEAQAEIESLYAELAAARPTSAHVTATRLADPAPAVVEWERQRRREILDWFSEHQFGRTPLGRTTDETFGSNFVSFPELGLRIEISCYLPDGATADHPVPVFVFGDHVGGGAKPDLVAKGVYKGLPIRDITSRGYAFVRWNFNDVCPNVSRWGGLSRWPQGVIAKLATGDILSTNVVRAADSWGTIGAWAWGNSRVMDWIESRPELDATRVAIVGHSRGGKTALWTGAQDARFAMVVSNGSGCGGAGHARTRMTEKGGETFKDILHNFPNWFCPAFTEWIGRDAEVTHDADDLIRLIAPRLVYVASGDEDAWACPKSEKAALDAARDLYRAYGCEDRMGYHCHKGPHKLHGVDWTKFMDFADQHWK